MSDQINDDPYGQAAKGKLKLKGDTKISKKKKKDKKLMEKVAKSIQDEENLEPLPDRRTKAELAFQKMQEKMVSNL